ncbi:LOW QUALITY PROTEIN: hypothetical protein MSG28_002939 [Choristoneura fumiferana]|uniref:Uncharacterized protein n=1 Tax=Choristoneura fumiferana TaxID=7141 RepID=A0ACC0JKA6_CHOFU|nr:LOW QUALITY PROTEIN: hypothetical protein MSG28_002939 [Choristoneura fumiferana]
MNPMTNVKNVLKLSKNELTGNSKSSWHDQYKDSAWVFVGGLPYDLTEGDIICVFSQYGEVVNINLVRDKATGRTVRVDHCEQYRAPNADMSKVDELTAAIRQEGCAPVIPAEPVIKQESLSSSDPIEETAKHAAMLQILASPLPSDAPDQPPKHHPISESRSHAKRIKKKLRRAKRRKRKEVEVPIQVISLMMKNQNNNWGNSFRTQETVQTSLHDVWVGDDQNPYTESVDFLEDLVIEFLTETTHRAMEVGRTGRVQVEDIIFLVRKDQRKYARVKDLLTMNEELKKARKAFDEVKYKISNNNDGRTTDSLLLRLMQFTEHDDAFKYLSRKLKQKVYLYKKIEVINLNSY